MSDPYNPSGYPQGQAGVHQAPPIGAQGAVVQPYGQPGQAYTGTGYASAPSGGYASAPSADSGYDAGYQQYQGASQQPGYGAGYQAAGYQQYQGGYQQPGYQQPYAGAYAVARKSKIAAGLLGIFLGSLGVHNFYLGRDARGGLQLGLTVAGVILSFIFVGLFVLLGVEVWALVEGILILAATPGAVPWGVDARGVPLSD
ncbi:hypothetical protein AXF14_06025 [Actinomyces radicidentis]|uniref:TM2 domain-containing protein n=1 Tax=Actinomyces radicidentis TaxID=111015 RepID=A0A0X8JEZ4_ACTRD|nr:TM2 domain-containing protein [Actinomyces radicidentis]AMD87223.1 hypothetical protein AXF14_06025 [Actinomyces radicidentis]